MRSGIGFGVVPELQWGEPCRTLPAAVACRCLVLCVTPCFVDEALDVVDLWHYSLEQGYVVVYLAVLLFDGIHCVRWSRERGEVFFGFDRSTYPQLRDLVL